MVIHYLDKKRYFIERDEHTACGRDSADTLSPVTFNKNKVTCKECKKTLLTN